MTAPHERAVELVANPAEQALLLRRLKARSRRRRNGCRVWTGCQVANGYGRISFRGQTIYTHRAALLVVTGHVPPGVLVLHSCDTPACVEPLHVRAGSPLDNMTDRGERTGFNDLRTVGARNGQAKLTEETVRTIRAAVAGGRSRADLAREVGVSRQTVSDVVARKLWAHVE